MNPYAIQTQELSRNFGPLTAVDRLLIEVPTGSLFGFLGPNGSGKTTTIRLLLGLIEPSQGNAQVLGYDLRKQPASIREKCGALLEYNGLYERLSAEDNLDFYGRVWRVSSMERKNRIKELLQDMELWDRRKEIVGEWSRGMKQKLAVARTLFHRPRLIFLDEPTAGLDPIAAATLRDDLAMLAEKEGVTVFLTTHNLAEAEKLCHQVAVIRRGKLLVVGSPDNLRRRRDTQRIEIIGSGFSEAVLSGLRLRPEVTTATLNNGHIHLDIQPDAQVAPIVSMLVTAGIQVEEVRKSSASLEEVFLTLMEEET